MLHQLHDATSCRQCPGEASSMGVRSNMLLCTDKRSRCMLLTLTHRLEQVKLQQQQQQQGYAGRAPHAFCSRQRKPCSIQHTLSSLHNTIRQLNTHKPCQGLLSRCTSLQDPFSTSSTNTRPCRRQQRWTCCACLFLLGRRCSAAVQRQGQRRRQQALFCSSQWRLQQGQQRQHCASHRLHQGAAGGQGAAAEVRLGC